jgi:hypothetical protein
MGRFGLLALGRDSCSGQVVSCAGVRSWIETLTQPQPEKANDSTPHPQPYT